MQKNIGIFIDWLEKQHSQIMTEETEALHLLKKGDKAGYTQKMASKAELLSELSDNAKIYLEKLPEKLGKDVSRQIDNFSANANMAIKLDSVFYMSALLYPDDYQDGEPDNLQRLIDKIKKFANS